MLKHPTLDQLYALGLHGMAKAFAEIAAGGEADGLGHHEWLGLLLDREASWRQDKRLAARLRVAKLRQQACVEDVDYRSPRGLDRALFQKLVEGEWINAHDNLALIGPTGVGKSWLASALGHKACRDNRSVLYQRVPRLFEDLALARGDGRHPRLLRNLGRADLLILDDWGLEPLDAAARHDLLEILEERYGRRSTMITSQLPVDRWHEIIGDPTYADAILDRLVHNAHRIELAGESMRRTRAKQTRRLDQTPSPVTQIHRPARLATRAASFRYGGRHHSGIPGGIIPFYPGDFVGIRSSKARLQDKMGKRRPTLTCWDQRFSRDLPARSRRIMPMGGRPMHPALGSPPD